MSAAPVSDPRALSANNRIAAVPKALGRHDTFAVPVRVMIGQLIGGLNQ